MSSENGHSQSLIFEPYLNISAERIYNPLTHRTIFKNDLGYMELRSSLLNKTPVKSLPENIVKILRDENWIINDDNTDLSKRFSLKIVSLEAHTVCNQACYFCPVSVDPREDFFMSLDFYKDIVSQIAEFKDSIETVFMINYNEPTLDTNFIEQVQALKDNGLQPSVNTNATGLTPQRVDAIMEMGGLGVLSVNLSTMDNERYKVDREKDHLTVVMKNLDYLMKFKIAEIMDLIVLGRGDENHKRDFREISKYFVGTYFNVKYVVVRDRAGYLSVGLKTDNPHKKLRGCEMVGSRPLQHLHINPKGQCFLCCEDYNNQYIVGDLTKQSVKDVLTGPELSKMRRWTYGIEEAPDDYICRGCINAITEPEQEKSRLVKYGSYPVRKVISTIKRATRT